jgi:hypothetical protein
VEELHKVNKCVYKYLCFVMTTKILESLPSTDVEQSVYILNVQFQVLK